MSGLISPSGQTGRVAAEHALSLIPRAVRERLVGKEYSFGRSDIRKVAVPGSGDVRLLIGPVNAASQAVEWARAAEMLPSVSACSLEFVSGEMSFSLDADTRVRYPVGRYSRAWAARQRKEIINGFTHVLYESETPILPSLYGEDLGREIADLQRNGVKVAMVAHGSDIRTPSKHVRLAPFSPFRDPLDGLTATLENKSVANRKLLDGLSIRKFVPTLDLVNYAEDVEWMPFLPNRERWSNLPRPQLGAHRLRVLHIPSRAALKGSAAISSAMSELAAAGVVDYRELRGVHYEDMPKEVVWADLVVDQVSMSLYGTTSAEAMLSGRLVVAEVGDWIREQIKLRTGSDLPVIEANPETLIDVITAVARNPQAYEGLITEGIDFANDIHSPHRVAETLRPFLAS